MDLQQFKELIKDEYEEISDKEWESIFDINKCKNYIAFIDEKNNWVHFKPKQKFPVVFETQDITICVDRNGLVDIVELKDTIGFLDKDELELLYKAVELSKKLREGKE